MMRCQIGFSLLVAWSALSPTVHGHFLWLRESRDGDKAIVTFCEKAGAPGPAAFLSMIWDKVRLSLHDADKAKDLNATVENVTGGAQLVAPLEALLPFSLDLSATFGVFPPGSQSLLRYWANADQVTRPNDWFLVQEWGSREGLEITIRDPWMRRNGSAINFDAVSMPGDDGDECVPHAGSTQQGEACVVAVVRFRGELLAANVNLTTFTAAGDKINATHSPQGVTILRVPLDRTAPFTEVFASVNYREPATGEYQGQAYTSVDHWATTYARLSRPPALSPTRASAVLIV